MFIFFGKQISASCVKLLFAVCAALLAATSLALPVRRKSRCAFFAFGYVCLLVCLLVSPVSGGASGKYSVKWDFSYAAARHFCENVALFVPIGFSLAALTGATRAIAFCTAFSASCELLQLLVSGRVCDVADLVANVVGAAFGSLVATLAATRLLRRRRLFDNGKTLRLH